MTIEFNEYGFCVDSDWFYIALDWKIIILSSLIFIGYKVYKRKQRVF